MTIQFNQTHQAAIITKRLLQFLKVNVHPLSINEKISNHPSPDSLLSISTSLSDWNIDNLILRLSPNEFNRIYEFNFPFISVLNNKGKSQFIFVEKIEDNAIHYQNTEGGISEGLDNFFKGWTGYALLAFPSVKGGEKDFNGKKHYAFTKNIIFLVLGAAIATCFIGLSIASYQSDLGLKGIGLIVLKSLGLLICSVLIKHDSDDSIVQKICKSGKSDCDKILKSKEAQLWGLISWSELGMIYFGGSLLFFLFNLSNLSDTVPILSYLNLSCVLFSFYSIWYQYAKAKEWCYFCLAVLILFWGEFLVFSSLSKWAISSNWQTYIVAILGFSLISAFVFFTKPFLQKTKELKKIKSELNFIKYDPTVFEQLLDSSKVLTIEDSGAFNIYGASDAPNTITIVTNPTCKPCLNTHTQLDDYITGSYENVRINIIFLVPILLDTSSDAYKVAKRIIALNRFHGQKEAFIAMEDWYDEKKSQKYDDWDALYPVENEDVVDIIALQKQWCEKSKIEFTPTIIFNQKQLPKYYQVSDLKYFMD